MEHTHNIPLPDFFASFSLAEHLFIIVHCAYLALVLSGALFAGVGLESALLNVLCAALLYNVSILRLRGHARPRIVNFFLYLVRTRNEH